MCSNKSNGLKKMALAVAFVLGGAAVVPFASNSRLLAADADSPSASSSLSDNDKMFIKETAMGDALEVKLANIALKNASSDDVKKFAQHMIDDHMKVDGELGTIAKMKGMQIMPDMSNEVGKAMISMASSMTGTEFDKHYIMGQIGDHAKMVSMFMKEAKQSNDSDLKSFASKNLPAIEDHLKMAKEIAMMEK